MIVSQAHARCAGAGRTNCSVGISEEGWRQIEEARLRDEQVFVVAMVLMAAFVIGLTTLAVWLVRTGRV